ncbi:hypothetical protein ACR5KS_09025 [Leucobacter sp. W1153]|uniref:hypothetical protein n=1 Tax=Leucobacter sp. W1153 TaxID=3439064 RepID=UPI003F3F98ED
MREKKNMNGITRNQIISSIHVYGRARAAGDNTLGSGLSTEEIVSRMERAKNASTRIDVLIHSVVAGSTLDVALVGAISEFAVQLFVYGSNRHDGHGPEAASDVIESLDHLIKLAQMNKARERAA